MSDVLMRRICARPAASGRWISTCTSRRPGRSSASSIMSLRLVMPMRRMLLSASTPSILESSWLTTVSCTPVLSPRVPRCLQMASISSKMRMCRSESSPRSACSFSASAKSLRMFSSDWPTYLLKISGPFTTLGSRPLSILPICRAIRVLPVPGGPKSSMPRTCVTPSCLSTAGGKMRLANARRKMSENSASRPPMPICSKLKSDRMIWLAPWRPASMPTSCRGAPAALASTTKACGLSSPRPASTPVALGAVSSAKEAVVRAATLSRMFWPSKSIAHCWPTVSTWCAYRRVTASASLEPSTCATPRTIALRTKSTSSVQRQMATPSGGRAKGSATSSSPTDTASSLRCTELSPSPPAGTSAAALAVYTSCFTST
mmetsp:Transcript_28842/g.84551  ORF Transcript_28842/g.84551 Transcript_28842/m.84551 type:complete len:375 (-) Transcript_28842:179-1303(-)